MTDTAPAVTKNTLNEANVDYIERDPVELTLEVSRTLKECTDWSTETSGTNRVGAGHHPACKDKDLHDVR